MLEQNKRKLAQIYAFLAFIIIVLPVVANNYVLNTFSDVFFYVVVCLGLNIVVGYAGLLDLDADCEGIRGQIDALAANLIENRKRKMQFLFNHEASERKQINQCRWQAAQQIGLQGDDGLRVLRQIDRAHDLAPRRI